jgi:hypothetical protein
MTTDAFGSSSSRSFFVLLRGGLGGIGSGCNNNGFLGGLFGGGNEWLIILVLILVLCYSDQSCGTCKQS